jgi:hypothetical protein
MTIILSFSDTVSLTSVVICCTTVETFNVAESESESDLLYDCRFTANHFVLVPSPLRLTASIFIN